MTKIFKQYIIKLTCTTNGSNKFYDIKIVTNHNTSLVTAEIFTAYGKIGTDSKYGTPIFLGQSVYDTYEFISTLIKSKIKKGYTEETPFKLEIISELFDITNSNVVIGNNINQLFTDEYSTSNITTSAEDINNNILKAAQIKKVNKIKKDMEYWFYSLESIRDFL